jgi:hypothetical protein
MRIVMINIYDVMNEHFSHAALKSTIALDAVTGTNMGPASPNTVYSYLHRRPVSILGQTGTTQVLGGMGAFGQSLATAAENVAPKSSWVRQSPLSSKPMIASPASPRLGRADLGETGHLQR